MEHPACSNTEAQLLNQSYVAYSLDFNTRTEEELYFSLEALVDRLVHIFMKTPDPVFISELAGDLLLKIEDFNGSSKLSTWVWSAVRFSCIDELRKKWQGREILFTDLNKETLWGLVDKADVIKDYENKDLLGMLSSFLTPRERDVLEMKKQGATEKEIADAFKIHPKYVSHIWKHIKEQLQDVELVSMGDKNGDEGTE